MNKAEAKKRIEKLRSLINRHRFLYHVEDREEISDSAFDMLKHELFQLEQQFPDLVTPDSPTQRVGGMPLDKFHKVPHTVPMLSIEDIFGEEELKDWEHYLARLLKQEQGQTLLRGAGSDPAKLKYFAELKVDGFAVSLQYRDGVFQTGSTRGNGLVGEDVTQNLKTIESIPLRLEIENLKLKIPVPSEVEVRGEVYMEKKDFERFNQERKRRGEETFANPRNLAAGSIRQLDPKLAASRPLKFLAYDLVSNLGQTLHSEEHDMLKSLGFKTDPTARICNSIDKIVSYWRSITKKRGSLAFMIDGVVAVVNDNKIFSKLGVAGKSPRGIRALKFSGFQATTRIKDIQLQVGRTGAITPVALLDPVSLAGVTISRATLHNQDEIQRLDVRVGDTVIVERAGDVIPRVVRVLGELREGTERVFHMSTQCLACGAALARPAGETIWRCKNTKRCPAQKRESLYHFVSKKGFDIIGLGPKVIDKLLDAGLISDAADLFSLQEGDLVPLESMPRRKQKAFLRGFAEKSSKNLITAIQQAKRIPLSRFLVALGIRHVGEETATELAHHFGSIGNIQKVSQMSLKGVSDIGNVVAQSITAWFALKENQKLLLRLLKAGVKIENKISNLKPQKLHGLTFVLTGSLESLSREQVKEKIRMLGGDVSESVSKKTNYLVVGKHAGSKLNKAKKLGTKILNEQEFLSTMV